MSGRTVVVDYGIGNVFSVCNALRSLGNDVTLTGDRAAIRDADRLILPGVGAFARAMEALEAGGIADSLKEFAQSGRPFLGICIGMQVLMERSHEFGEHRGLGFMAGEVVRVDDVMADGSRRRVPHIGWAGIRPATPEVDWSGTPLANLAPESDALYFVHSYHCSPARAEDRLAVTFYDGTDVTAAIKRDNIVGVQFHPERSGSLGMQVLQDFIGL